MKTALVTFVYPKAGSFFQSFLSSLENQTDTEFVLIVFNDNCTKEELSIFQLGYSFPVRILDNNSVSIAQNRMNAFQILKREQYKSFIFCDIDDVFALNRIEIVKSALKDYDIVINELSLYDINGVVIQEALVSQYLQGSKFITADMIKEQNLIGFSHLAVNYNIIECVASINMDHHISIVDWVIMSHVLQHYDAYFEGRTYTQYVLHQDNIALSHHDTMSQLLRTIDIKINTYAQLLNISNWYRDEMKHLIELQKTIKENEHIQQRLMNYCKGLSLVYYPWWSLFKNSEELRHEICI